MRLAALFVTASATLALACSDATGYQHADTMAHQFGWSHAVTTYNTELAIAAPLGHAETVIAGHSLREIVTDSSVRVRGDDQPCRGCHAWADGMDRETFCTMHVPMFEDLPTSKGDGNDPPSAKPRILKELFADWKRRGCPD